MLHIFKVINYCINYNYKTKTIIFYFSTFYNYF